MRRYRMTLEVFEDDKLIRRMEESRDKLDNDYSDGERTVGLLMSFVPQWSAADAVGGDGLATLAYMCYYLPRTDGEAKLWKRLGEAYDRWGATHNFTDAIKLDINQDVLECNAVECDHPYPND